VHPQVDEEQGSHLERCIEIFEQYCIATQSIRQGIPVEVGVVR
jgi:hypothetical protein